MVRPACHAVGFSVLFGRLWLEVVWPALVFLFRGSWGVFLTQIGRCVLSSLIDYEVLTASRMVVYELRVVRGYTVLAGSDGSRNVSPGELWIVRGSLSVCEWSSNLVEGELYQVGLSSSSLASDTCQS